MVPIDIRNAQNTGQGFIKAEGGLSANAKFRITPAGVARKTFYGGSQWERYSLLHKEHILTTNVICATVLYVPSQTGFPQTRCAPHLRSGFLYECRNEWTAMRFDLCRSRCPMGWFAMVPSGFLSHGPAGGHFLLGTTPSGAPESRTDTLDRVGRS